MKRIESFCESLQFNHSDVRRIVKAQQNGIIKTFTLTTKSNMNARRDPHVCLWCGKIPSINHDCESKPDYNCWFTFGEEGEGVAFVKVSRYGMQRGEEQGLQDDALDSDAHKLFDEESKPSTSGAAHQIFDEIKDGDEISVAQNMLDEMPVPIFIIEMAEAAKIVELYHVQDKRIGTVHNLFDEMSEPIIEPISSSKQHQVTFSQAYDIDYNDFVTNCRFLQADVRGYKPNLQLANEVNETINSHCDYDMSKLVLLHSLTLKNNSSVENMQNGWQLHISYKEIHSWGILNMRLIFSDGFYNLVEFYSIQYYITHSLFNCCVIRVVRFRLLLSLTLEDKGDFMGDGMVISWKGVLVWENGRGFDGVWDNGVCKMTTNSNSMLDCEFLEAGGIMDYSLLVGIHLVREENRSRCKSGEGFLMLSSAKVPDTSKNVVNTTTTLKECQEECLRNCSCSCYTAANDIGTVRNVIVRNVFDPGGSWYSLGDHSGRLKLLCSQQKWSYQVGLKGEGINLASPLGVSSVDWVETSRAVQSTRPLSMYKAYLDAPGGVETFAVDTQSMRKGEIWINGQSIGRYWTNYAKGRVVNFRHTIIIMTSNIGSKLIEKGDSNSLMDLGHSWIESEDGVKGKKTMHKVGMWTDIVSSTGITIVISSCFRMTFLYGLSFFKVILFTFDPGGLVYETYRDGYDVRDVTDELPPRWSMSSYDGSVSRSVHEFAAERPFVPSSPMHSHFMFQNEPAKSAGLESLYIEECMRRRKAETELAKVREELEWLKNHVAELPNKNEELQNSELDTVKAELEHLKNNVLGELIMAIKQKSLLERNSTFLLDMLGEFSVQPTKVMLKWRPLQLKYSVQIYTHTILVFDPGGYGSESTLTKRPQLYPYGAKRRKLRRRENYRSYVFNPGGSLVLQDYESMMFCGMEGVLSFILEDKDNFKGSVMIHTK